MQAFTTVWTPSDHERLLTLLDALTAVHMDLAPLCSRDYLTGPPVGSTATIAAACGVLHTAIADLRNVIKDVDDMVVGDHGPHSFQGHAFVG